MAVSAKNFKFISPQIHIEEIDKSQIPAAVPAVGPVIIGRAARGPAFTPVRVESFSEFVQTFGNPVAGGTGGDVWRNGNYTSPMYGPYAIQSWLKNGEAATYIRLLGVQSDNATDDASAKAGWSVGTAYAGNETHGGAYGIFVAPSGSATEATTGSLAAIFYLEADAAGNALDVFGGTITAPSSNTQAGSWLLKQNEGAQAAGVPVIATGFTGTAYSLNNPPFSFVKGRGDFVRKVFNTNPTLLGRKSDEGEVKYFLGETFENSFLDQCALAGVAVGTTETDWLAAVIGLGSGSAITQHIQTQPALTDDTYSKSGWFLSQDTGAPGSGWSTNMITNIGNRSKKMFRFVGLDAGEWTQNNLKISLVNIQASSNEDVDPYATFTVQLRQLTDNDGDPRVVESFVGCNMNAESDNYLLKKVGTKYIAYDETAGRTYEKGEFDNNSKYIRVELASDYTPGPDLVPFGVTGPTKWIDVTWSGTTSLIDSANPYVRCGADFTTGHAFASTELSGSSQFPSVKLVFPEVKTRTTTALLDSRKQAYWGAYTTVDNSNEFYDDVRDLVRAKPVGTSNQHTADGTVLKYQYAVSLDNVTIQNAALNAIPANLAISSSILTYDTASRNGEYSLSATASVPSNFNGGNANGGSYKTVLQAGSGKLTTVFFGGVDGFDITVSDPFANSQIDTGVKETSYEFMSFYRAIETIKNPESVAYNIAAIPGLRDGTLINLLLDNTTARADALAVVGVPDAGSDGAGYVPPADYKYDSGFSSGYGDVTAAVTAMRDEKFNTSYGAVYYPWVKIRDSVNSRDVWVPPSVAALGAMAYTDRVQAPWFAPAGFNRGGLSSGQCGLAVVSTAIKLFKDERDDLYEVNVNPIANFPNEGVVMFGQKTLQVERSALDRINVRRLLIFLKRGLSRISNRILFEPNVPDTWNNFKNQAIPFLDDVKSRFGLTDYKLVLDESTTTPDLIDQNIMYAKLFLKPARAIEFIALDFIITNTGASFDD